MEEVTQALSQSTLEAAAAAEEGGMPIEPSSPAITFSYLFVPTEDGEIQQRQGDGTKAVTDFVDDVKPQLIAACKEANHTAALRQKLESGQVSIDALAESDMVRLSSELEILTIVLPTKTNGMVSVSLYFNPHAVVVNSRATALAHACGHTQSEVRGDAFMSRVIDDEVADIWKRIDITAAEFTPDAVWVSNARLQGGGGGNGGAGSSVQSTIAGAGDMSDYAIRQALQSDEQKAEALQKKAAAKKMKAKPNESCPCKSGKKYKKCHGDPRNK